MPNTSINDFDYELPTKLIAKEPNLSRQNSKLLYLNTKDNTVKDKKFRDVVDFFNKGDILILNNTKVIPGRMILKKTTGGKVEILYSKIISEDIFEAIYSASRPLQVGTKLLFNKKVLFTIINVEANIIKLEKKLNISIFSIIKKYGMIPLPKYIKRIPNKKDYVRYQTVYAKHEGSVAAPTAGLHFTNDIISRLKKQGVIIEYITLHISYNTFKPIKEENYKKHKIGSEYCKVTKSLIKKIKIAKEKRKKVIAVGTTVARTIEHYASLNISSDFSGYVDLFITPGFKFKMINNLITNFHLPKSTLLLLVCAFAGRENILRSYKHAINNNYRFYSYGDCMYISV
tara:strand:+ start:504 stop:1535 length:1032 start_codon:yes stop_codon:yes gene_type:complete